MVQPAVHGSFLNARPSIKHANHSGDGAVALLKQTEAISSAVGRDFSTDPHTVFLSDVHLDPTRPEITAQLFDFLNALPSTTENLYIVGDLFEAWIGDDAPGETGDAMIEVLRGVTARGIAIFFTHGNRDFLIGSAFADACGLTVLPDETVISCYGTRLLLMHGDTLCTDDTDYQTLRATLRNPDFQANLLAMSVPQRLDLAKQLRSASASEMSSKSEDIMDVNADAVRDAFARHDVKILLHGHTHRPRVHTIEYEQQTHQRIVLGDWFEHGSVLYWSAQGAELQRLPR
ncbi:MAG: UDP-2,3-diacylglucosamine diphosphatase [Pseudomonadota bacterium]